MEEIIVLYDVSSAQRLIDMAKLVYGLGFKNLVVVKAYGAAASSGLPEANRIALKHGRSLSVLPTLRDMAEIFNPVKVFVVSREYGEPMRPDEIAEKIAASDKPVALIFGGIDPAPGKEAASIGEAVYIERTEMRLGPVAEAAIILRALIERQVE